MKRRTLLVGGALALGAGTLPMVATASTSSASAGRLSRLAIEPRALGRLLDGQRARLGPAFDSAARHQLQLLLTRIDRDPNGVAQFRHYGFRVDRRRYFWPASLVKLPVAAFALERAAAWRSRGVDRDLALTLFDQPACAADDPDDGDAIARSVWRALIVSDNAAYSRLFDVVGPDYAAQRLITMGHGDARIVSRFLPCSRDENQRLAGLSFSDARGLERARLAPRRIAPIAPNPYPDASVIANWRDDAGDITRGPVDFSSRNALPLEAAHQLLLAVIFPNALAPAQRFALAPADLDLIRRALSTRPRDSLDPRYDPADFPDAYSRLFAFGNGRRPLPDNVTVWSKNAEAWGFLAETAYLVERDTGTEFLVSGVGYFNADGVLNDDAYDYEKVGYPFFEALGQVLLDAERARPRRGRFDPAAPFF